MQLPCQQACWRPANDEIHDARRRLHVLSVSGQPALWPCCRCKDEGGLLRYIGDTSCLRTCTAGAQSLGKLSAPHSAMPHSALRSQLLDCWHLCRTGCLLAVAHAQVPKQHMASGSGTLRSCTGQEGTGSRSAADRRSCTVAATYGAFRQNQTTYKCLADAWLSQHQQGGILLELHCAGDG